MTVHIPKAWVHVPRAYYHLTFHMRPHASDPLHAYIPIKIAVTELPIPELLSKLGKSCAFLKLLYHLIFIKAFYTIFVCRIFYCP